MERNSAAGSNPELACCGRYFKSIAGFVAHQNSHAAPKPGDRRRKKSERNRVVLVPDGLGNLERVLTNPTRLAQVSLQAIPRFLQAVNLIKRKFSRRNANDLQAMQYFPETYFHSFNVTLPRDQAIVMYQLARAQNVSPLDMIPLICAYGIEYLSKELKNTHSAPTARVPNITIKDRMKEPTPHEEYLAEKGVPTDVRYETITELRGGPSLGDVQLHGTSQGVGPVQVSPFPERSGSAGVRPRNSATARESDPNSGVSAGRIDAERFIPRSE